MFDAKEKSCRKKGPVVIPAHGSRVNLYLLFYFVFQILDAFPRSSEDFTYHPSFCTSLGSQFEFHNPDHFKWGVTRIEYTKSHFSVTGGKELKCHPPLWAQAFQLPCTLLTQETQIVAFYLLYDLIYLAASQKQIFKITVLFWKVELLRLAHKAGVWRS